MLCENIQTKNIMYIILLSYKADLAAVDKYLPGHNGYLQKNYRSGAFVCSGPQIPRTGGVILCRAQNEEAVLNIIREDPFIVNGVADYQLICFRAADYADGFEQFLDKME
jgi:uncharacterized protein YciI